MLYLSHHLLILLSDPLQLFGLAALVLYFLEHAVLVDLELEDAGLHGVHVLQGLQLFMLYLVQLHFLLLLRVLACLMP